MKKTLRVLDAIEVTAAITVLVVLIAVTVAGVVLRYVFDSPFKWMEEYQLASMVWLSFLGAPVAFTHKGHVAIELIVDSLPMIGQKIARILIGLVVYLTLAYLLVRSLDFLELFLRTGRTTPIIGIPYTVVYGIAPISCVLMVISYTGAEFVDAIKSLLGGSQEKAEVVQ